MNSILRALSLALALFVGVQEARRVGKKYLDGIARPDADARLVAESLFSSATEKMAHKLNGHFKTLAALLLVRSEGVGAWQLFGLGRSPPLRHPSQSFFPSGSPSSSLILRGNDATARTNIAMQDAPVPAADLLSRPVPELVDSLTAVDSTVQVSKEMVPQIIMKVAAWSEESLEGLAIDAQIEKQSKVQRTYQALARRGLLSSYGACADQLLPLGSKEEFKEADLEKALNLKDDSATPEETNLWPASLGFFAIVFGLDITGLGAISENLVTFGFYLWIFSGLFFIADEVLTRTAGRVTLRRTLDSAYSDSVVRHEAGRLLVSYLMGGPAVACNLDPISAIQAGRYDLARGGVVIIDPDMGDALRTGQAPDAVFDRIAIGGMGGIAAEALVNGKSKAGEDALRTMRALFGRLKFARAASTGQPMGLEALTSDNFSECRWGFAQAYSLIKKHRATYDALVLKLKDGANIGEAMVTIQETLEKTGEVPAPAPPPPPPPGQAKEEKVVIQPEFKPKSAEELAMESEEVDLMIEESEERINLSKLQVQQKGNDVPDEELEAKIEMSKLKLEKLALSRERKQLEIERIKLEKQMSKKE